MSVKKFKFISPGIFLSEVDNSQLPAPVEPMGPIIIGRSQLGPAMRPVKVESFSDFVQTFGDPVPGKAGGDIWRNGNLGGPTYGPYAAQAYFKPQVGPVTYMRLLGAQHPAAGDAGAAGWKTSGSAAATIGNNGGAYGLFLVRSGSSPQPGFLAAVFYVNKGAINLSGSVYTTGSAYVTGGTCGLFNPVASTGFEYVAEIFDEDGVSKYKTAFNFVEKSAKFVRKVFNTNPQLTNGTVVPVAGFTKGQDLYWLGESYASWINLKADASKKSAGTYAGYALDPANAFAVLLPLETTGGVNKADLKQPFTYAETGWFIGQDLSTDSGSFNADAQKMLFRLIAQDGGRWVQDNLKVSIQDIRYSRDTTGINPYGSFSVVVRASTDNDNVVRVVEQFSNVNLNPNSQNYIARKIGTKYMEWDESDLRLREYGEYNNLSRYIRVEMQAPVDEGVTDPRYLPFGVFGPQKFANVDATSGSITPAADSMVEGGNNSMYPITGSEAGGISTGNDGTHGMPTFTTTLHFPDVAVRHTGSAGGIANPTDAYFGLQTSLNLQSLGSLNYDPGFVDYLWPTPGPMASTADQLSFQWVFTLDDLVAVEASLTDTTIIDALWESGSRKNNDSMTCKGNTYEDVLDAGYDRFTTCFAGGFDGLDITELEPFRNTLLLDATPTTNYAYYTVKRALDTVADPEFVECNLMTYPGLTDPTLTKKLMDICEDRGDALGIIDIQDVYTPFTENTEDFKTRIGTVNSAVSTLEQRQLNSSYGCAYYPWVQIRDTIKGNLLWAPPSVIALGTFASSQAKSELWFAPAGFNRGGLTDGSAGLPVLGLTQRLTSKDRDNLYETNINPIASFPSEGIVVFGQKTLQTTPSALDRINVRRLLVYIKKEVSRIAATILFDQNVKVTWERFLGQVNPFLSSVQSRLGLTEFRVILDSTTTTPDLIDRNILYAKIFLKPARAIEFIAIDFVITRTGASFED